MKPSQQLTVFVQTAKRRPTEVGTLDTAEPLPGTWSHDGHVFTFATADLVAGTATYWRRG